MLRLDTLSLKDNSVLLQIQQESIAQSLCWSSFSCFLNNPFVLGFIAKDEDIPVGFILGKTLDPEIYFFCVRPNYRKNGVGSMLLSTFMEHVDRPITLEVFELNQEALSLYKKYGFEVVQKRLRYYGSSDAFVMIKK